MASIFVSRASVFRYIRESLGTILFLALAIISILLITEMVARQEFFELVDREIDSINSELNEFVGVKPESESPSRKRMEILRNTLFEIRSIKREVQSLISHGAEDIFQTLFFLRQRFQDRGKSVARTGESKVPFFPNDYRISYQSSHTLLAILVMLCGVIGSLIAALRKRAGIDFRYVSLGIAAGFVTFLAIKGGRNIFLIQIQGNGIVFNPYSSAFAGLLAGLFTERAYQLLSSVVDEFIERVQAAMSGSGATAHHPPERLKAERGDVGDDDQRDEAKRKEGEGRAPNLA